MRERTRTAFIVTLLVATFLLSAFMALRAQMAATYHRATAEKVIRDWTRVAADELARRADAQGGFYGTYPILQRILAMPRIPSAAELDAPLVVCVFRYENDALAAPECPADVRDWLRPRLAAIAKNPPPPADRAPLHLGARTFVYAVAPDARSLSGFEVDRKALATYFGTVLATRPLIPRSLAEGRITNDVIRFRVRDGGRVVFENSSQTESLGHTVVRVPIEEGLFRGMTVDASIAPKVAPLLVFGGIPRPLRIYMITLVATGVLLLIAVLQLRKERELARLRSDFIAGVSHELRTPLTQIRMFAETLLLDRVRSDEERRRSLTVIDQETRRLAQLVENVLQFSRGQRGTLRLTRERIDVAALVAETVEAFLPIAAARDVTITTTLPRDAFASVDRDAMRQVVLNLLDNAVKYGPARQEVWVSVETAPLRIIIDDAGPGIPARDRKRIWRRYERLERESGRALAGAGIGLAVVRELVTLHGGSARVEESSRGGAKFVVEMPS